jgi:hypothetical protein
VKEGKKERGRWFIERIGKSRWCKMDRTCEDAEVMRKVNKEGLW